MMFICLFLFFLKTCLQVYVFPVKCNSYGRRAFCGGPNRTISVAKVRYISSEFPLFAHYGCMDPFYSIGRYL